MHEIFELISTPSSERGGGEKKWWASLSGGGTATNIQLGSVKGQKGGNFLNLLPPTLYTKKSQKFK